MRSLLTAFGVGAGLSLIAAAAFALIAPKIAEADDDGEGVHIINIGDGQSGSFRLKDDERDVAAKWTGDFTFAADGRSLTSLKGRLEIDAKEHGRTRKAIFENRTGAVIASAETDGDAIKEKAGADRAAADLLQLFARSSGVNADGRVKALMAAGGKDAVLAEIGQLVGSHAVGAYIEALTEQATLTDADVAGLAMRAKTLDSDYAKRIVLSALLTAPALSDASTVAVLDVAKTIEGDHELRLIIEELAEKPMSERNLSVAAALIKEIDGDHEVRLAVEALLEGESLADKDAARLFDVATKKIEGDYDLRLVIEAADERLSGAEAGAAAVRAIGSIEGGHDRRLAIESFASALDDGSRHWPALIDAAKGVEGDHDRRLTIEAIAGEAPQTGEIQVALRKVAETIGEDHDRRLALEAIE